MKELNELYTIKELNDMKVSGLEKYTPEEISKAIVSAKCLGESTAKKAKALKELYDGIIKTGSELLESQGESLQLSFDGKDFTSNSKSTEIFNVLCSEEDLITSLLAHGLSAYVSQKIDKTKLKKAYKAGCLVDEVRNLLSISTQTSFSISATKSKAVKKTANVEEESSETDDSAKGGE